ncbi:MAG: murein L,D-transpeptidase [Lentisphaerae bacterium]|nr:murein L,D-transpeptidase [Lentisphaerota bacterium]
MPDHSTSGLSHQAAINHISTGPNLPHRLHRQSRHPRHTLRRYAIPLAAAITIITVATTLTAASPLTIPDGNLFTNYRHGFHLGNLILQIQLDRHNLSPNCIDGVWGPRTEIALLTWQTLHNLPVTGIPDNTLLATFGSITNIFTTYTVTSNDLASLTAIPTTWPERAAMPRLGYETIREKVAELGHMSQRGLENLNPGLTWPNPPAGTVITIPSLPPTSPTTATSLHISLTRTEVTAYDHTGTLIALFPCSIAAEKKQRPAGALTVTAIAPNPNYTYDPQLFFPGSSNTTKLIIPPGPNNPVGLAWISLSLQGYGIHGTPIPEHIGRAESKGCFRLANWNAVKLLRMVQTGTPVTITE